MKKSFRTILSVLLVITLLGTNCVFAERSTTISELFSEETVEWLEWFNNLSTEDQFSVNYRPYEVIQFLRSKPDRIPNELLAVYHIDNCEPVPESFLSIASGGFNKTSLPFGNKSTMPTGGYELAYVPSFWNMFYNNKANCYTYALNFATSSTSLSAQQPGVKSGIPFMMLTGMDILAATNNDISVLSNLYSIRSSNATEVPGTNEYKVALVIAPGQDYHWYRQNPDGTWSHKRGHLNVSKEDASGNIIDCPATCDRYYSVFLNYSNFVGYYIIKYNTSAVLTNQ